MRAASCLYTNFFGEYSRRALTCFVERGTPRTKCAHAARALGQWAEKNGGLRANVGSKAPAAGRHKEYGC